MAITMSLDLTTATLGELSALVEAASAAGVSANDPIHVDGSTLSIVVEKGRPTPQNTEHVRDSVRQVLSEDAVRGVVDALITKNTQRRS